MTPLWACLYFPALPIDRQAQAGITQPAAIIEQIGARKQIMACNAPARQQGVHAGLTLKSAYALIPDLHIEAYDADAQALHLDQLALWGLHYSSWITLRLPDVLLMEVQASLKLFGGMSVLLKRLAEDAVELRLTLQLGVAHTPGAATLLARAQHPVPVRKASELKGALAPIPIELLTLDDFTQRGLRQSGIRTLGQMQSLPPASLTRRFGHACTTLLYQLDGTLPDPCPAFVAPDSFRQGVDLPLEAPDTSALAFPLNRLLNALGGYLGNGDLGVKKVVIVLYHHRLPPTLVNLNFLDATSDHKHLFGIATERLGNTRLPAPVIRMVIEAAEIASVDQSGKDLFQKSQSQTKSIQQVIDNLASRLGEHNVHTAMPGEDHRPEKAWLAMMLETQGAPATWPARPAFLLRQPCEAPTNLERLTPPERIENGWWDATDVRRDYFIARDGDGAHYWVYQVRSEPGKTWIHGLFS